MSALLKRFIQHKDQGRKNGNASDHADKDTLCHDQTEVSAHGETHEAQSDESGNGRNRASDDARQRLTDRHHHSFLVIREPLALLVVAVPQEDGIVHGDRQLKDGGECFCNIGDLAEKDIRTEIQNDHHADRKKEDDRGQEAVQQKLHRDERKHDRNRNVDRFLFLAQFLKVRNERGHTGNEALLISDLTDIGDRLHRLVGGCGCIEEYRHDSRVVGVKRVVQFLREHLHRDRKIQDGIVPNDRLDVFDLFDLRFQGRYLKRRHVLYDHEGKSTLAEFIQQLFLADDGLHVLRQVIEHIVVHSCVDVAKY